MLECLGEAESMPDRGSILAQLMPGVMGGGGVSEGDADEFVVSVGASGH